MSEYTLSAQYTLNAHAWLRYHATRYVRDYGFVLVPLWEGQGPNAPYIKWKIDGPNKDGLVDTVEKIDRYWPDASQVNRRTPRYGIAIACGPSGIVAIDFDTKHKDYGQVGGHMDMTGPALLDLLTDTFRQKTRSGGTHMLYRYDHTVEPIICATNKLVTGVDVKGHRGLLAMAPTQIYTTREVPSTNGKAPVKHAILPGKIGHEIRGQYELTDPRVPAPLPASLLDAILEMQGQKKKPSTHKLATIVPTHTVTTSTDTGKASADHYFDKAVGNGTTGQRNETGLWLCLQLRDLGLSESDIRKYAYTYVGRVGNGTYTTDEIDATIDQVMGQQPRSPAYIRSHTDDPVGPLTDADIDAIDDAMTRTKEDDPYNHTGDTPIGPQNGNGAVRRGNAPSLPAYAHIDDQVGVDACPWLDDYVDHSCTWSTRAWSSFHTAVGLWILSTIAARRIMVEGGAGQLHHTGLFLLLTAPTSTYAKTTTARIGLDTINDAGLSHLLLPDDLTPQALVRRMSATSVEMPTSVTPKTKDDAIHTLQFAGQRGWIYEEFGSKVTAMMNDASNHSEYKRLFRVIFDSLPAFETETLTRGNEKIYRPYIALLGMQTPADLVRYAGKNNSLWNDGFWPRFIFASPPQETAADYTTAPSGKRSTPRHLIAPLRNWHLAMRIPSSVESIESTELTIQEIKQGKKPKEKYVITKDPEMHPETVITWDVDARDARDRYDQAMFNMSKGIPEDLRGLYARQPNKALRIAGLFASMAGSSTITLSHYARAQAIMEIFRTELHHVYDTTTTTTVDTGARKIEDKLIQLIGANVTGVTKRDIYRRSHLDTATVEKTLQQLQDNGIVTRTNGPKTATYTLSTTYD
jgi:hypothetical protein